MYSDLWRSSPSFKSSRLLWKPIQCSFSINTLHLAPLPYTRNPTLSSRPFPSPRPACRFHSLEKNEGAAKYWSFRLALDYGFIDTDFPDNFCIHPPTANWMDLNVSNEMPSEVQLINLTETFDKCWGSSPCSTATSTASMTRAGEKSVVSWFLPSVRG